jgi:hypothetical protein
VRTQLGIAFQRFTVSPAAPCATWMRHPAIYCFAQVDSAESISTAAGRCSLSGRHPPIGCSRYFCPG